MIVKFENANHDIREIGRCKYQKEAIKIINEFLDAHNYKAYYMRTMYLTSREVRIDVGSWSEFFYIECEDGETFDMD